MQAVLRALDALDLDGTLALFSADGSLTTVVGEQAEGRDRVRDVLGVLIGGLRGMHHEVTSEWHPSDEVWIAELSANYELADYSRRGPFARVIVLRAGDAGIEQMRVYGAHELPLEQSGRHYAEVRGADGWLPTL